MTGVGSTTGGCWNYPLVLCSSTVNPQKKVRFIFSRAAGSERKKSRRLQHSSEQTHTKTLPESARGFLKEQKKKVSALIQFKIRVCGIPLC